ncbi:10920_t:CDS:1 [Diversispora eburnea]|uniref:10920_t:CDS:1 n=1 Tax=Diversispora eburnea TaxID=1213867 RepID=A0A9N8YIA4_9GLOM|nr:10920_t:CDS:1 [Diversispora eburnea]
MNNRYQQIPYISTIMSPPLSPRKFKNEILSIKVENAVGDSEKQEMISTSPQPPQPKEQNDRKITKPKSRFRMFVSDAPSALLDLIKRSEIKKPAINTTNNEFKIKKNKANHHHNNHVEMYSHKTKTGPLRSRHRKNPCPVKSPSKSSPGITLKLDVFTPFKENPMALLHSDDNPHPSSLSDCNSNSSPPSLTPSSSSDLSQPSSPNSVVQFRQKKQRKKHNINTKNSKLPAVERKRKSNSLSRVMADRGLLETSFNNVTSGEIKSIRLPPPPPMEWEQLIENINNMNLDMGILNHIAPKITWKGQPLSISHLPHFNALHPKEVIVASTLRLTPVQYLTSKNTLVSAAQRYVQRSLPFRKSDAQKLLRIDVNKASKLWEFFQQVKWI